MTNEITPFRDPRPANERPSTLPDGRLTRESDIAKRGCERCRWHFDNVCYTPALVNDKSIEYDGGIGRHCPQARKLRGVCGIDGRFFEEHISPVEAARLSRVAVAAMRAHALHDINAAIGATEERCAVEADHRVKIVLERERLRVTFWQSFGIVGFASCVVAIMVLL